jgi:drug/metabolite transporter (DMT)-like permease
VFLGETVSSWLWVGAIMILGASAYNMQVQAKRERQAKPV